MKSLLKYIKEDFDDWLSNPLYRGGIWEDIIVALLASILLAIVIGLAIHGNAQ
jgi:hypothetical protein